MRIDIYIVVIVAVLALAAVIWLARRQRSLKQRAHLMEEAIRNHDFTFRLPTDGLLPGERAMQQTLNQLGETIRQQVNQNEVESWERLTRVLTHEIMNATAPIASISQSMLGRDDVKGTPLEPGIQAIHTTSQHLNTFIESYRKLSLPVQPKMEQVDIGSLLGDIRQLYPSLVWADFEGDAPPRVNADASMLRQILTNIVKNAVESEASHIGFAFDQEAQALHVSNDGQPIPAEVRQSIFVPFFTTKHSGNGIGLSISRRMMIQQGGNLRLAERPQTGYHTTFVLEF